MGRLGRRARPPHLPQGQPLLRLALLRRTGAAHAEPLAGHDLDAPAHALLQAELERGAAARELRRERAEHARTLFLRLGPSRALARAGRGRGGRALAQRAHARLHPHELARRVHVPAVRQAAVELREAVCRPRDRVQHQDQAGGERERGAERAQALVALRALRLELPALALGLPRHRAQLVGELARAAAQQRRPAVRRDKLALVHAHDVEDLRAELVDARVQLRDRRAQRLRVRVERVRVQVLREAGLHHRVNGINRHFESKAR